MKLLKEFRIFGKDRIPEKGVTPEQQKVYEEQLKERAKTGRIVTGIVCVMNIIVSLIIAVTNMGWLLAVSATVGLFFSLKGRSLGRITHLAVCFLMALIGYSVELIIFMSGSEEFANLDMLYKFMSIYGVVTMVFLLRSKVINSWFEYAGNYKCRYQGKKYFE